MRTLYCCLAALLTIVAGAPSLADQPADETKRAEAAEHFARGLHLFENEDNQGALAAFARAYDLIPNRVVQFNMGLVYAAMGKPVEAVDTLTAVLAAPAGLKPEQIARAGAVKAQQEAQIGWLHIATDVPADLDLDGIALGRTPLSAPLRVASGTHVVVAVADRHLPARQQVDVAAGARVDLSIDLRPADSRPAAVWLSAPVPGAEVLVDGAPAGRTPLAGPLKVAPGSRVIEVRRPGYRTQTQHLSLAEGEQARISLVLEPEPDLSAGHYGRVHVATQDAGMLRLSVDGRGLGRYHGPVPLPAGPHRLRLERDGYEPIERTVQVAAGADSLLKAELRPTAETRRAYRSRVRGYQFLAYSALIGGIVIAAGGGGYTYWSHGKLNDANATFAEVQAAWRPGSGGACDHNRPLSWEQNRLCDEHLAEARNDVGNYRDMRTAGIVVASIGAAAAITGVVLLATGPDPKRYDDKKLDLAARAWSWQPLFTAAPNGGWLGLVGRF